jgi:antitoxin PrlF
MSASRVGRSISIRKDGSVTISAAIRRAARLAQGDILEVELTADGILLRPRVRDPDQAWFWEPAWQAGEREADAQVAAGDGERFESDAEFLAALGTRMKPRDADV